MDIKEIEAKLHELKVKQSEHFQAKKADRNASELEGIRSEMNELKAKARELYRERKVANKRAK